MFLYILLKNVTSAGKSISFRFAKSPKNQGLLYDRKVNEQGEEYDDNKNSAKRKIVKKGREDNDVDEKLQGK